MVWLSLLSKSTRPGAWTECTILTQTLIITQSFETEVLANAYLEN